MTTGEIFYEASQIKTNKRAGLDWRGEVEAQKNFDLRESRPGRGGVLLVIVVRRVVREGRGGVNESKCVISLTGYECLNHDNNQGLRQV